MSCKLEELKKLREKINLNVKGVENLSSKNPKFFVANHNCLMDIFYLPASLTEEVISLISPRLMFKKEKERQDIIYKYLNPMPIEAHGGGTYSKLCLEYASNLLSNGFNVSIFPEGAYIQQNEKVFRARTGMSRILIKARKNAQKIDLIPVAIDIKTEIADLDNFYPNGEEVSISFLEPIDYEKEYQSFLDSESNELLHEIADKSFEKISEELKREYSKEYITLRPKNNVIFESGETKPVDIANSRTNIKIYEEQLYRRVFNIKNHIR